MNSPLELRQNVQIDLGNWMPPTFKGREVTMTGMYNGYYQPCMREEYDRRVEAVCSKIEAGTPETIRLSEYQDWAELDWMYPQGTYAAGAKIGQKLAEEAQEYYEEITPMASRAVSRAPNRDTRPGMSEAGDYLWMLSAMASNSGIDLEEAMRAKFKIDDAITLGDLHEVTRRGFGWLPLRIDNPTSVGTAESDARDLDPFIWLRIHPVELFRHMYQLYGKEERDQQPLKAPEELRLRAADWHADAVLFLGYYMHHWTYSSLSDVAAMNVGKITDRVRRGTVDKTKGGR